MYNNINNIYPSDKKEMYKLLASQMKALLEGETNTIANLANASALLNDALIGINWVGFYIMNNGELVLGPFQGKVACVRIAVGKGVCGAAVEENATQLVMDVHNFPGHIACDSASNSELVVPLRHEGAVVGVLDIDSPQIGRFDMTDADELEKIARIIEVSCQWNCNK
ncbi:GAF domain-containing protein [Ruminiclostridium papyrosolvens]|uniref:Free methionine-(R)-sulfoxide reductase n=1 Tax=Ruminiclostridium papyrosolvens C7 TaxID=1330534 RepID=U4QXH3_9FIRM|nr:GAF domain-containing protein [Ruminiclostridium papyrosolvens]EPR09252.1 Free methionine-(R)-sulfoxide reductase [Ruminiclostridium papyrosolvens C7]